MQLDLFDDLPALYCWFGTPFCDHFDPPVGTGRGCAKCDAATAEATC